MIISSGFYSYLKVTGDRYSFNTKEKELVFKKLFIIIMPVDIVDNFEFFSYYYLFLIVDKFVNNYI